MPQQTASARPDKDHELPHKTGNGSEPTPVTEPRCRCCRRADLRERINRMLANGFSLGAILEDLQAVNAALPPKASVCASTAKYRRKSGS